MHNSLERVNFAFTFRHAFRHYDKLHDGRFVWILSFVTSRCDVYIIYRLDGILRWPVDHLHKRLVMRNTFHVMASWWSSALASFVLSCSHQFLVNMMYSTSVCSEQLFTKQKWQNVFIRCFIISYLCACAVWYTIHGIYNDKCITQHGTAIMIRSIMDP